MSIFRKLFKNSPKKRIRLTEKNIGSWPLFQNKLKSGNIKFDSNGRLRYKHGAPVGDLVLIRINNDGTPKYKETADEWFDPESELAKNFEWSK